MNENVEFTAKEAPEWETTSDEETISVADSLIEEYRELFEALAK